MSGKREGDAGQLPVETKKHKTSTTTAQEEQEVQEDQVEVGFQINDSDLRRLNELEDDEEEEAEEEDEEKEEEEFSEWLTESMSGLSHLQMFELCDPAWELAWMGSNNILFLRLSPAAHFSCFT